MIKLHEMKTCADYQGSIQVEGSFNELGSLDFLEQILKHIHFRVFSIGNPRVLIGKRTDCMIIIGSNGTFNISQVLSHERLANIVSEIQEQIIQFNKECEV